MSAKRFYSKTTGACYIKGTHAEIPKDAVEIDDERYNSVIANPAPGTTRSHDSQGLPILVPADRTPVELSRRNGELVASDWLVSRHRDEKDFGQSTTLSQDQFSELLAYRQALRDWPQSPDFPVIEQRPAAPPWIADQTE